MEIVQENPNLEGASLTQVLNLALDPNNKTSQMALRRGFAGGEPGSLQELQVLIKTHHC